MDLGPVVRLGSVAKGRPVAEVGAVAEVAQRRPVAEVGPAARLLSLIHI